MRSMDSNPPSCAPPLPCHPLANGPAAARPPPGGDAARGWKHPPFSPGLNHVPTREPPPRTPAPTPALPPREKDQRPGERGRHGHAHTARVSTPQSPQHPPRLKTPPPAPPTSPTPGPVGGSRCRGGGGGPWNTPGPPRPPRREDAAIPGASRRGGVTARSGRGPSPGPARRGPVAPPTVRSFAPSRPRPGAAGGRRDAPAAREGPRWGPSARPPPRGPGDTAGRVGHGVGGGWDSPRDGTRAQGPRGCGRPPTRPLAGLCRCQSGRAPGAPEGAL